MAAGRTAGALPNVIVIGAMKCGTSAMHYYLDVHPEISMSSPKELNFFCAEPEPPGPLSDLAPSERSIILHTNRNWARGAGWYAAHFDKAARLRGEASPNYTAPWHPRAAERMASLVPEASLILLVRDPFEQIVSQYMHYRDGGNEPRSLAEAVADPHGIYLERARYHARLAPYLDSFPRERIIVIAQDDLRSRRRETLARIFRFLDIDDTFWSPRLERIRHRSGAKGRRSRLLRRIQYSRVGKIGHLLPQEAKWYLERLATAREDAPERPTLDPESRARIAAGLGKDVARLRKATGMELREWAL